MKIRSLSIVLALAPMPSLAAAATLSGQAVYPGTPPKPARVKMMADPTCVEINKSDVMNEALVVNANGTLRNVFVWVKGGLEGKSFPAPATPVTVDQRGCWYYPRVQGVRVGQPIEILNSDPTLHNVHAAAEANRPFNLAMSKQGQKLVRTFDKPEVMVKFKCDVHPWMAAYFGVVAHPFFAVTDGNGAFSIRDLPAGTYTVGAWHEKLGTLEQKITVTEGKPAEVKFAFPATN
jgi:plastocyanin